MTTSHRGRTKKPRLDAENTYPATKPQGMYSRYSARPARSPTPRQTRAQPYHSSPYHSPLNTPEHRNSPIFHSISYPTVIDASPRTTSSITRNLLSSSHTTIATRDSRRSSRPTKIALPTHRFEPGSFVREQPHSKVPLSPQSKLPTPPYDMDCGPLMQLANIALPNSPVLTTAASYESRVFPLPPLRTETSPQAERSKPPSFAHLLNPQVSTSSGAPPSPAPTCGYR